MKNVTELQKEGYKGLKVTSMLNACLSIEIKKHLRMCQLDELSKINNKYFKLGYISKPQMTLLWNIYFNFVLNDFRFEDKNKEILVVEVKTGNLSHVGMKMYQQVVTP